MKPLTNFVLVHKNKIISPNLITVRTYGAWLQDTFDEYTCNKELFILASNSNGKSLEYHAGTKIGNWFDSAKMRKAIQDGKYKSWYIMQGAVTERLKKLRFIDQRDIAPCNINGICGNMLRVYTIQQIELYIRTHLDKSFDISKYAVPPKQITISDIDFGRIIKPELINRKKRLF